MAAQRLRLELSGAEHRVVDLPAKGTLVVGSSEERAGFVVTGQGIEDAHCAIGRVKGGGWAIKDLGSRYGTLVNGSKVTSCRLSVGDVLLLGSQRLTVVDPSAPAAPPPPLAREVPAPRAAEEGATERLERLGGYRIEKLLGRGGMGAVYLAVQENLNRPVALKVLSPARAADAAFVARFQAEARAAAALHHPNVVVVHDVGAANDHHYLSMEYMAGGSLEERVGQHGPIPWREALDILACAARGLAYAEEKGIVHRDIKPDNLMVDATGTTKIADLGLATGADEEDLPERKVHGTPHFISPEQARGEPVDGRSDLYSLGATAYRLITGRTPFSGETTREILRAHFTQEPAPIEEVPESVDALVRRLLRKDPAERFATAAELREELERLRGAAGGPVEGAPERGAGKRALLGLVVVTVAALGGLLGWKVLAGGPAEAPDEPAVAEGTSEPAPAAGGPGDAPDGDFFASDPETPALDEERELKVLELQAELAYNKLGAELPRSERIVALDALAAEYPTTSYGSRASSEAEELRGEERRAAAEARRRAGLLTEARDSLRANVGLAAGVETPPAAGAALRALLSWVPPAGLTEDAVLGELRRDVASELVTAALPRIREELAALDALLAQGDFDGADRGLTRLLGELDLPSLPEALEGEGYRSLVALSVEVAARAAALASREAEWKQARRRADAGQLAAVLGPAGGFGALLEERDLAGLITRLRELVAALATDEARALPERLLTELEPAQAALTALVDGFARGEWQRTLFLDASGRRMSRGEAVGATTGGLLVQQGEGTELRRWKTFGPREFEHLFKERLSRDYTPEERRGVAALLVFVAVDEVRAAVARELSPARRNVFQPSDAEVWLGAFEPAASWLAADASLPAEVRAFQARERSAAVVLGQALVANEEDRWGLTVASLETLFREHGDSLLVALFSDGGEWRSGPEAPKPAAPPAPVDDAPPATEEGDG